MIQCVLYKATQNVSCEPFSMYPNFEYLEEGVGEEANGSNEKSSF